MAPHWLLKINQGVRVEAVMLRRYGCLFAACLINKGGNQHYPVDPAEHVWYLLILADDGDVVLVFNQI
jgi:hypothetical protein